MIPSADKISLIAALSSGTRAIGRNGDLLWQIPEDLKRFKALTAGHPVIMGRKTWESLPEKFRPLPGRTNIIVTRDMAYVGEGAVLTHSLEEAIAIAKTSDGAEETFIIGGGELYAQALSKADRLYLTIIESDEDGDTYFPAYEDSFTNVISSESHTSDNLEYSFRTLERG